MLFYREYCLHVADSGAIMQQVCMAYVYLDKNEIYEKHKWCYVNCKMSLKALLILRFRDFEIEATLSFKD